MIVHLVDGTYELFRQYFGQRRQPRPAVDGKECGATWGVVGSVVTMLASDERHVGVATDHVIESFRNDLWPGYKDGAAVPPTLLSQFELLESALRALGVAVWIATAETIALHRPASLSASPRRAESPA